MATSSYPSIVSHKPNNNDTGVDTGVIIEVFFSDDMDSSSITPKTFAIYKDNNIVPGNVEYFSDERKAIFTPYDPLAKDTNYTVIISNAIMTISNEGLEQTYVFSFTTQAHSSLDIPSINYPKNQSVITEPKIVWDEVEYAETYFVEIAKNPNFNNPLYASDVFGDNTFYFSGFETNTEYFVRVMAKDVVYDTENAEEEIYRNSIVFYSDEERKIVLDKKYRPLEEINSFKVVDFSGNEYDLTSKAKIASNTEGSITFSAQEINISKIIVNFNYGIYKDNSRWSETHSFYYEKESKDFKDLILGQVNAELIENIKPTQKFNVDTKEITFTVNKVISVADISVELVGSAINDIPHIESHGLVDGLLEIVKTGENYTDFKYGGLPSLLENNEYIFTINIDGDRFKHKFFSIINPLFHTVKAVRNSDIEEYIESITDEKILYKLYDNSILAEEIAESSDNSFDRSEAPLAARMFVLEKTKYKLLYSVYLGNTSARSTSLGDFKVSASRFDEIKPVLEELKTEIKFWEDKLKGLHNRSHAKPVNVQKAEGTYGLSGRTF